MAATNRNLTKKKLQELWVLRVGEKLPTSALIHTHPQSSTDPDYSEAQRNVQSALTKTGIERVVSSATYRPGTLAAARQGLLLGTLLFVNFSLSDQTADGRLLSRRLHHEVL